MAERRAKSPAKEHTYPEITLPDGAPPDHLELRDLKRVPLVVSADLGACRMPVREVLELKRGSVIQLDKLAGEMSDVYVNGLPLAKGEIVVIGDTLHVRIGEIVGAEEGADSADSPVLRLGEEDDEDDEDF